MPIQRSSDFTSRSSLTKQRPAGSPGSRWAQAFNEKGMPVSSLHRSFELLFLQHHPLGCTNPFPCNEYRQIDPNEHSAGSRSQGSAQRSRKLEKALLPECRKTSRVLPSQCLKCLLRGRFDVRSTLFRQLTAYRQVSTNEESCSTETCLGPFMCRQWN